MTEKELLDTQMRLTRHRLRRKAGLLGLEAERTLGPTIREHPRTSLGAGALAGLLIGRGLAPARAAGVGPGRGPVGAAWSFVKGTAVYALRASLVGALIPSADDGAPAEQPEG